MSRIACATRFFAYGQAGCASAWALRLRTRGLVETSTSAPLTRVARAVNLVWSRAFSLAEPATRELSVTMTADFPEPPGRVGWAANPSSRPHDVPVTEAVISKGSLLEAPLRPCTRT